MNIVVLVKQVPDTESERRLVPGSGTLDRAAADGVINELDEFAIEEGLRIAETHGGEVTILSMGPERAAEAIRKALSMGADKGVHLVDDALAGSVSIWSYSARNRRTPAPASWRRCWPSGSGCRSSPSRARWRSRAAPSGSIARPTMGTTRSRLRCPRS